MTFVNGLEWFKCSLKPATPSTGWWMVQHVVKPGAMNEVDVEIKGWSRSISGVAKEMDNPHTVIVIVAECSLEGVETNMYGTLTNKWHTAHGCARRMGLTLLESSRFQCLRHSCCLPPGRPHYATRECCKMLQVITTHHASFSVQFLKIPCASCVGKGSFFRSVLYGAYTSLIITWSKCAKKG